MKNGYTRARKILFPRIITLKISMVVLFAIIAANLFAQQRTISGTVTGNNNQPLPAVSVFVQNTARGASTDNAGRFTIEAASSDVLVFRSIGYQQQTITVGNQTIINVAMVNATDSTLNDVVVIGYQTVRRRDLTGATSVVNTQNSNKIVGNSVVDQLQGQSPGVTVRTGGAPGQNSVIEIRGVASFRNSDPLYVIDGMIADANSTVNTDDIATIQILKDASAAAIYGSRAANGVVIITTKKGRNGAAKITASARYSIQQIPKTWDVMNASQYLKTVSTEYQNSNATLPAGIAAQLANNTVNTNWQDAIYRTGNEQDYNIGMSGGSATGNYLVSASYYKNEGVLVANDFERASLRVNTEIHKGILTVGENMVLSYSDGNNPGGGVNAFYEAPLSLPIIPVQSASYIDPRANPGGWGFGTNDIPSFANNYIANASLDKQSYNYSKVVGNAYADLKFTNWLSYRFNAGIEASFDYHKEVRDSGIWRYEDQMPATSIGEDRERFTNILLEHTLNFNKSFGLHNINGVVGYSYQDVKREFTSGSKLYLQNINGQLFTTIVSANGPATANGGIDVTDIGQYYRTQGYLGRLNYNYADKYLLTFSGRIDQDSRFGPANRTGDFYAAAGAWRIAKESFFQVPWISDLKLRGSYGQLGISPLAAFEYLGVINNSPRAIYGVGQSPMVGEYTAQIVNPDLHWEQRNEANIGFDASLMNNIFNVTVDLYNNLSKGVLIDVPIGFYQGSASASATSNAASIRNKGIEATFTYNHHNSPFSWDVSVNGTTISNMVESVGHQAAGINYIEGAEFSRSEVGHPNGCVVHAANCRYFSESTAD